MKRSSKAPKGKSSKAPKGKPSRKQYAEAQNWLQRNAELVTEFLESLYLAPKRKSRGTTPSQSMLPPAPEYGDPGYIPWYYMAMALQQWIYAYQMAGVAEMSFYSAKEQFEIETGGTIA